MIKAKKQECGNIIIKKNQKKVKKMKLEINIEKMHFWILLAVVVLLGGTALVFATGYSNTLASHITLFADTIRGKTGGTVTVNDNLAVTGSITLGGVAKSSWTDGIPSEFCVFSDTQTSCPAGWTRRSQFDGKTIQGSTTPGTTGGAASHNHAYPPVGQGICTQTAGASVSGLCYTGTQATMNATAYTTVNSGTAISMPDRDIKLALPWSTTGDTSSWPPYVSVLICCKT